MRASDASHMICLTYSRLGVSQCESGRVISEDARFWGGGGQVRTGDRS